VGLMDAWRTGMVGSAAGVVVVVVVVVVVAAAVVVVPAGGGGWLSVGQLRMRSVGSVTPQSSGGG